MSPRTQMVSDRPAKPLFVGSNPTGGSKRKGRPQQSHCLHGHPLSEENVYRYKQNGYIIRVCRICQNDRNRRSRATASILKGLGND